MRALCLVVVTPWILACERPPSFSDAEAKLLVHQRRCTDCHDVSRSLVGPPFRKIASYYGSRPDAVEALSRGIRSGSEGRWGPLAMPQQRISPGEAEAMSRWILSLTKD